MMATENETQKKFFCSISECFVEPAIYEWIVAVKRRYNKIKCIIIFQNEAQLVYWL
jgi:hypothetical protein